MGEMADYFQEQDDMRRDEGVRENMQGNNSSTESQQNGLTIKDYVESAYLHGLCVENLDTGELEPPKDISEVQWIVDRLKQLFVDLVSGEEPYKTWQNRPDIIKAELRKKIERS